MIITLLSTSVLCGFLGAGSAFYWGLGPLLIILGYFLSSFLGATAVIIFTMSRFERHPELTEKQTPNPAVVLSRLPTQPHAQTLK